MKTLLKLAASFAVGAAAMYYLDPATGRRRRALALDQGAAARRDMEDYARAKSKLATDRMRGMIARTRAKSASRPLDDQRLHEQIRSRLGHAVGRPGMIEVKVEDGRVSLSGSATQEEIDALVATVAAMRGVTDVDNRMSPGPADAGHAVRGGRH